MAGGRVFHKYSFKTGHIFMIKGHVFSFFENYILAHQLFTDY